MSKPGIVQAWELLKAIIGGVFVFLWVLGPTILFVLFMVAAGAIVS